MAFAKTVVLLIHGLGTTGAVWSGVRRELAEIEDVMVITPDLPGHGSSGADPPYTIDRFARAAVRSLPECSRLVIVGHSIGGYVALALAGASFGVQPAAAMSIGAKLHFSEADLARGRELAIKPVRWFDSHAQAQERYRMVAGLPAIVCPDDAFIANSVIHEDQGFRLAADQALYAIEVPPFAQLLAAARCPVTVLRGERDALVSAAECKELARDFIELPGLGHNAHAEDPQLLAKLILPMLAEVR